MNLEGQNLESLRKMIRHLQEENQELKTLLKKANIPFNESTEQTTNEKLNEDVCIKDTYITNGIKLKKTVMK